MFIPYCRTCVAIAANLLLSILEKGVLNRSVSTVVFVLLFSPGCCARSNSGSQSIRRGGRNHNLPPPAVRLEEVHAATLGRQNKRHAGPSPASRRGYFEGRDEIKGPDEWWLTTRVTRYADSTTPRGYDPVHTAPFQMIPNGVVAMMEGTGGANVSVSTESGDFSFRLDELGLGKPKIFAGDEASAERIPTTIDFDRRRNL